MEQKKKIPLRQCVGCCERKPKGELIRVVRTPEGEIVLDSTGRKNGRGCYLCASVKCFNKAKKSGKLASHLECAIPDEVYAELGEKIEAGE
ncbi:MAG: YlxR family protein [Clostridia bacterium]|nr:YlxR family protein [Clostridia bacterium]MBR3845006.1 YlxR family protein [Clostridia bacterium]